MMTTNYLDALDKLLLIGTSQLSQEFIQRQGEFVIGKQSRDGGFTGRLGGADLYYTDFGLRLARLLSPDLATLETTGRWLAKRQADAQNLLDCFSLLNAARLLRDMDIELPVAQPPLVSLLRAQQLAGSGFCRPGSRGISAYNTFIAALCCQMLEMDFPNSAGAVAAILGLKQSDGGCCESLGESLSQTNATSAALAFLTMQDALDPAESDSAADFLSQMQATDGGLLAQPSAPEADLLSTFTGALTLFGLNALDRIDLPAVAQFVGKLVHPRGGFRACPSDDEPDIEYTYYGMGTMALLRVYVLARQG